jgi:hypothetical protein
VIATGRHEQRTEEESGIARSDVTGLELQGVTDSGAETAEAGSCGAQAEAIAENCRDDCNDEAKRVRGNGD